MFQGSCSEVAKFADYNCDFALKLLQHSFLRQKSNCYSQFVIHLSDFQNAFTISFPERDWLLQAPGHEEKLSYMSTLTQVSSSSVPMSGKLLSYR